MSRNPFDLPSDRVIALPEARIDALATMIARDQRELVAVVHRPSVRHAMPADVVHAAVDRLEQVAVELLPAWLPEAAQTTRPDTAGLAAIRAAAGARARRDHYPGTFLPDLAAFAVSARRAPTTLPLRTRAAALTRLVADAFGRRTVVMLVEPDAAEAAVVAAGAGWLVHHGGPAVWLTGGGAARVEGLPAYRVELPPPPPAPAGQAGPAVVGKPHPASDVEKLLEAALAAESWAAGRRWNQSHQSHPLSAPVRLDLLWPDERCVVEIDGPEHCRPDRFEADRQRDVQLQLDGYAVLRFTNARVIHDVGAVVQQIGEYLRNRRRGIPEGPLHGRR
ncbi:endonuclease domain-containing protein [Micromonospora sp. NPDC049903]|uniref:endonuclease domain-containing protein n=1 Tax=Micromonospora sp. NPDC049903 TaxID=3364276 RepID=UPI0037985591